MTEPLDLAELSLPGERVGKDHPRRQERCIEQGRLPRCLLRHGDRDFGIAAERCTRPG
jgi:hypothetical protein